ncbi:hypothetical protein GT037_002555 [Alternaria burnsii]|uniref:Calcium channel YVC1-like C-terminal transmembrane domain-containing protein n=1 Tax=Alternaria burnsii TaxID=1187904 RepID=A0A8H7BBF5_9PLEO|nr:uncharacterized protein GT037_002555 [Alternaria burnsii]KAF7680904.1 hypothetical protein GT037_002555 [Alternaria burnsii]
MSMPSTPRWPADETGVPDIVGDECFGDLADKLCQFFEHTIKTPHTFEDLRRSQEGKALQPLILYLSTQVDHSALVSALLALKGHFSALEEASDEPGVNEARGYACEFVAWQFLTNLKEADIIESLLVELPPATAPNTPDASSHHHTYEDGRDVPHADERSPLLPVSNGDYFGHSDSSRSRFGSLMSRCENLSALELATVSGAKKFLSQRPVQKIINGLWKGDIVFWETLNLHSEKKPKKYNRKQADPFSRLRVPLYLKIFETLFFAAFLGLYYAVLVQRNNTRVTVPEILLYVWIASFAYDEFADWLDAGQTSFYASDFWWTWDISIVVVGLVFCIMRIVGLTTSNAATIDLAYDVLGLEALFLVPRIFALLSLNRYFGTLIPCLKEMTKDFVKFLSLVVILYLGFLTTFVLLARDSRFNPKQMASCSIEVTNVQSIDWYIPSADVAEEISPFFGPPVMLIFVTLTNILLITSLISLLSNSLRIDIDEEKVLDHARDEYLFIYSVYVLEASSSNRLTYFLPPLNLIPLVIRPLRLVFPSERLRSVRIVLLKATHLPLVSAIWAFEQLTDTRNRRVKVTSFSGPQTPTLPRKALRLPVNSPRLLMADAPNMPGRRPHKHQAPAGFTETDAQLKTLVLKLSAQVEELTAMVSQAQQQREASTSVA